MESRFRRSDATSPSWRFSTVPVAWHVDPIKNISAGAIAVVVSLPLSLGLGALVVAPFGPDYIGLGMMAGLHAAAFLSLIAVLAGSRGVAIYAPRGMVVFSIAAVVSSTLVEARWLPKDDPAVVISAVFLLLSLVGLFQLAFALARLPRMVKYLPAPVLAGFQNAAAIAIMLSQLPAILGVSPSGGFSGAWSALQNTKFLSVGLCVLTILLIAYGRRISRHLSPLLTGLFGGILTFHVLAAAGIGDALGGTLAGIQTQMPSGAEMAGVMAVTQLAGFSQALPDLLVGAASIAVVASIDVLISAKVVENMSGQRGNSTRELLSIGTANLVTPLLGGIAGSISLASTTTSYANGARNSLSQLSHGLIFLAVIVFFASLLQFIPKVVVAAVVVYAGYQLLDKWTIRLVKRALAGREINWRNILSDLAVIFIVAVVALFGQIATAVGLGILISAIVFTVSMSQGLLRRIRYADEVQSRRSRLAKDSQRLLESGRRIMAIDLEGPIFFATAEQLQNRIESAVADQTKYIILDFARVTELDSTGAQLLVQMAHRLKVSGVSLLISSEGRYTKTIGALQEHGVLEVLTNDRLFPDLDRALEWCENDLLATLRQSGGEAEEQAFDQLDLVRGLDDGEKRQLLLVLRRAEFQVGEAVFKQGEVGDALYLILQGSASVKITTPTGDRRLMSFSAGTVFGEMALLDRECRSATVIADAALLCYLLDRASFETLRQEHPQVAMKLLSNMAREMSLRLRIANRANSQMT